MSFRDFIGRPSVSDTGRDRSLGFGASFNAIALVLQGGLRLAYSISVARVLGPAEYGRFALALAVATVFSILWPAPAGAAFSKFISRERERDGGVLIPATARHLLRRQAQFLLFASFTVFLLAMRWGIAPFEALAVALLCVGIGGQGFGRGVHMSLRLTGREAVLQIGSGAIALLVFHTLMSAGFPGSPSLAIMVLALAFVGYSMASIPRLERSSSSSRELTLEIDRFVLIAALGSIASAGAIQVSIAVSSWLQTDGQAGLYAAAVSLALPLSLLPSALSMVLYPRMAAYSGTGNSSALRELHGRATRMLGIAAIVTGGVAAMLLPLVVPTVLGPKFEGAVAPASVLVLAVLASSVAMPSVSVMSTRTNRAALMMSIGAWVGFLVTCSVWALFAHGSLSIALGYLAGTWTTATFAIAGADRLTGGSTVVPWISGCVAAVIVVLVASPVLRLEAMQWGSVLGF